MMQFENTQAVSLEEMLNARDRRVKTQKILLENHRATLISFTLNIPGQYKVFPLAKKTFAEGISCIESQINLAGGQILEKVVVDEHTGCEAYFVVNIPEEKIKKHMITIEEEHPIGRLFDMDVFSSMGESLHGADAGRNERKCIVCGEPVWACSRNRTHSAEELSERVVKLMDDYFALRYADWAAEIAVKALLYEVAATPKPGLVDRVDNGSHKDMDIFTFIDSALSLTDYFRKIALQAIYYKGDICNLLPQLRYPGRQAETHMFEVTNGINTHKGAIFTFGILCASMGLIYAGDLPETPETLLTICGKIASELPDELSTDTEKANTHGERAFANFGLSGIRGEAAQGYPNVARYGYPALKDAVESGSSLNDAGVIALLHLIANVDDTNIVARSDLATLKDIRAKVTAFVKEETDTNHLIAYAAQLNKEFIKHRISPGGSADLLAASYFLYFFNTDTRKSTL